MTQGVEYSAITIRPKVGLLDKSQRCVASGLMALRGKAMWNSHGESVVEIGHDCWTDCEHWLRASRLKSKHAVSEREAAHVSN